MRLSTNFSSSESTKYATIGETSIIPSGGMMSRSGRSSHSVRLNAQRTHGEYGAIWNHDYTTRTSSASCSSPNVHDTSSVASPRGPIVAATVAIAIC